jgi:manganese transport protein
VNAVATAVAAPRRSLVALRPVVALCGPGVVVAVAYVDPGNFATNTQAGAQLGTRLVWVVVAASVAAMLVQYLSAKLGAVTGRSLPELCRERYPRPVRWLLWAQAEVVTMATDVAEVLGGALALYLLFGVPMPLGGAAVAAAGVGLLALRPERRGRFDVVVGLLLAGVFACFLAQTVLVGGLPAVGGEVVSGLAPSLAGQDALLLATGIVGATVMPHAVYLHSALARRDGAAADSRAVAVAARLRRHRRDIVVALTLASTVNIAILLVAARVLFPDGLGAGTDPIVGAYHALGDVAPAAGIAFGVALLVSGLAASGVGTLAGDVVMQGFWRRRIPLTLRRLLTLGPALAVLALSVDPTTALVLSQVVLSCGVPFVLVPLLHLTADRRVMGPGVNRRRTTVAALLVAVVVSVLDVVLVAQAVLPSG